jgi:hypothetical protein
MKLNDRENQAMAKKHLQALQDLQLERAAGDGDCALNSVALVLSDPKKLAFIKAKLEKEKQDMTDFNRIAALIQQAGNQRLQLQTLVAPALRQLAVKLIQTNPQRFYEPFAFNLQSVFTTGINDDIFCRHDFILKKFAELRALAITEEAKLARLLTWFKRQGFKLFLQAMSKKGEHAGNEEIVALADYFGMTFLLKADEYGPDFVAMNTANGGMSARGELNGNPYRFSRAQIKELTQRGVAQKNDITRIDWEALSQEDLDIALSAIPEYDMVRDYIEANHPAFGSAVPAAWNQHAALMEQLRVRGVVTGGTFAADNTDAVKRALTLTRIAAIENKDFIVSAWQATYVDAPVMALQHQEIVHPDGRYTGHWDAYVPSAPVAVAAPVESAVTTTKPSSTAFLNETLKLLESGSVQPVESEWTKLVADAEKEEATTSTLPATETVMYDFVAANKKIAMKKDMAEKLDKELAKKLQQEEYQAYLSSTRRRV